MSQTTESEATERRGRFQLPPAFRYPAYRAYWLGTLASVSGFQMLNFGQFWLVFELTESPLYLGYVGAANAISAITLNLFGGVYADKLDKRRLIIITQLITAALIFLLAFLTVTGVVAVWHILAIAFVTGAVNAFDQPARQALYPHLIERSAMVSAVALNSAIWQGTRIFAPAVAGVIIASLGTS
ncbi:MAG TPA: MFS transporter, partial [Dehalococcoidia bacterium]|nr:MFS transporter [Dehalococcoidia bacterium]